MDKSTIISLLYWIGVILTYLTFRHLKKNGQINNWDRRDRILAIIIALTSLAGLLAIGIVKAFEKIKFNWVKPAKW